jgi:hypothetical protein
MARQRDALGLCNRVDLYRVRGAVVDAIIALN